MSCYIHRGGWRLGVSTSVRIFGSTVPILMHINVKQKINFVQLICTCILLKKKKNANGFPYTMNYGSMDRIVYTVSSYSVLSMPSECQVILFYKESK